MKRSLLICLKKQRTESILTTASIVIKNKIEYSNGEVNHDPAIILSYLLFIHYSFRQIHFAVSLAVFKVDIKIFLSSRQSFSNDSPSFSVMYSDKINNLNQYSVSAVSLSEI